MLSSTSSSRTPARSAISRGVGGRPSSWLSAAIVRSSSRCSSCTRRGTRTAQPRSRKWRFSSPRIVGIANDENCEPAVGLEALDRLEQADERDLAEVVERLAAVREAADEELGEAHVFLDELVPQVAIARAAVFDELRQGRGVVARRLVLPAGHR